MAEFCELAEQIRGGFSTLGKVSLPNPWDPIPHGRKPWDSAGDRHKEYWEAEHHDTVDRAFLWVDVAYKFLLVSFLAIVAVMGGEVLALFILRFMFLASLNLLSLWDLFVVGFAGSVAVIAYLLRFTLEKIFDSETDRG